MISRLDHNDVPAAAKVFGSVDGTEVVFAEYGVFYQYSPEHNIMRSQHPSEEHSIYYRVDTEGWENIKALEEVE